MFLEKSSVFKQFSHRKIPVRQADRDRPDIYFDKVEFTLSFDLLFILTGRIIEDTDCIDEINGLDDELKLVFMEMLDDEPQNRPEISNLLNSL